MTRVKYFILERERERERERKREREKEIALLPALYSSHERFLSDWEVTNQGDKAGTLVGSFYLSFYVSVFPSFLLSFFLGVFLSRSVFPSIDFFVFFTTNFFLVRCFTTVEQENGARKSIARFSRIRGV